MIEHNFKKKFGQNFITDVNLLQAIVKDAGITSKDYVLEIGAGAGTLTKQLSEKAKKVVSYEIDKDLQEILEGEKLENVVFHFEDALKKNIKEIEKDFPDKYKIVANLPYYITTPLLFKFLEESEKVESISVMVQKEVAQRIVAEPGVKDYGVLTVMVAFYGTATITREVKRQMFYPQPNVDSAVVKIDIQNNKYGNIDKKAFSEFIKKAFSMRRKTLANNISGIKNLSKIELKDKLHEHDLTRRAEDFSIQDFVNMFKALNK